MSPPDPGGEAGQVLHFHLNLPQLVGDLHGLVKIALQRPRGGQHVLREIGRVVHNIPGAEQRAGGKEDISLARRLLAEYDERWPEQWLRQRGLQGAADYWRSCHPHPS